MKAFKYLMFFAVLLALSSAVFAASVSRSIPDRVSPGETVTVTFSIGSAEAGKLFTLEDDLPDDWKFSTWEVSGSQESKDKINHRSADGNRHGWSFTPTGSSAQIKYTAVAGAAGSASFDAVWFDASGQSRDQKSVTVRNIACGDNVCEGDESESSCPADCRKSEPQPQPVTPQPAPPEKPAAGIPTAGILVVVVIVLAGLAAFFLLRKKK